MNSINPALSWNTVTKGRRSKKPAARRLNYASKAGNCSSPKRVRDFSGSDSDKFGEVGVLPSTSGKSENVPIKKRRHLLPTPPPHQDYACRQRYPFRHSKDSGKLVYPSCSSEQRPYNWQLEGFDSKNVRVGNGFDFSGIELLAAAASMDDNVDYANVNEDGGIGGGVEGGVSLTEKHSEAPNFATHLEQGLESNRSENFLSNTTANGGNVDYSPVMMYGTDGRSLSRSPGDGTWLKVNRQHWDLNTSMDDWDEPNRDSVAGNTLKDVNCGVHLEEREASIDCVPPIIPCGDIDESNLEVGEYKSAAGSPDRTCNELHSLIEHLPEPPKVCADKGNPDLFSCDVHEEASDRVPKTDATCVNSPFIELSWSSGRSIPEEKINISDIDVITQDENCSSNFIVENVRTASFDRAEASSKGKGTVEDNIPSNTTSVTATDVRCKEKMDSWECREVPGTVIQDTQLVLVAVSDVQNGGGDETFPSSATTGCQGQVQQSEHDAKYEYNNLSTEGLKGIGMEHSSKSSTTGAQHEVPNSSIRKIDCTVNTQHDLEVSHDIHFQNGDEDGLNRFPLAYDSPYEDGELRGSFSYSWEDNELENECVDYESDGRNDDGSTAADCLGSGILEDGSDGSQRRSSSVQRLPEGNGSKSGPNKHYLKSHFVRDDSDNNEMTGKGSCAGSGTTVDQSLEMIAEKIDTATKRRQMADRREIIDVKFSHRDEYTSKTTSRRLQSQIEGRLLDGKDVFYVQHSRGRRVTVSYSRPERDMSPEKHLGRCRLPTHGERDGVRQWTPWGSSRRYTTNYRGTELHSQAASRNITGDLDKMGGLGLHDPRQTIHCFSKSLRRPLAKSLGEQDEYFGVVRKRTPATRGRSNYRSRGHYLQCTGGDFGHDFERLRNDGGAPVRLSRYNISRRSFSPSSDGRPAHMPIPRRRSRSRSISHSPRAWHSHRERFVSIRRHSRSPDFRYDSRLERVRLPLSKPTFASDYEEGYTSPSRDRFSSKHSGWVDNRTIEDNHLRHKRSPARMLRRGQRHDAIRPGGGLKPGQYFRPMIHPGRLSFRPDGDRECKFGSGYHGRRHDDSGEMLHRRQRHSNDGGNIRRFRRKAVDEDLATSNTNNEKAMSNIS